MSTVTIYSLSDSQTGEVRYVGKTMYSLSKRLYCHIFEARHYNKTYRHHWINSILSKGGNVIIDAIIEVSPESWEEWEKYYIKLFKLHGGRLTNLTDGGDGQPGLKHTEETKKKMSKTKKGMKYNMTPEGKAKLDEIRRRKRGPMSQEDKDKRSKATKGRKMSEEHKKAISEASKGKPKPWLKGKVLSTETLEKMKEKRKIQLPPIPKGSKFIKETRKYERI